MAASPKWKVYDSHGVYQASCKETCAAACLMGLYGEGATIRHHHNTIVWTEGKDGEAGESYDVTHDIIMKRLQDSYTDSPSDLLDKQLRGIH